MSHRESQDTQLFVYLQWRTRDDKPVLHNDQLRQAAFLAITARTRSQLCHIVAIDGTSCQIGMIVRFPASFPISTVLKVSREAAQEAVLRHEEMMNGCSRETTSLWDRAYTAQTVSACDAAEAHLYLRQRIEA